MTTSFVSLHKFRIRYGETDQMGTFYNARVLDWFECGRTEFMRQYGLTYVQIEAQGVFLPVVESYVKYLGRARYDDLLVMRTAAQMTGKVRVRFDMTIDHDDGRPVAQGYTVHAFVDHLGKPTRPSLDLVKMFSGDRSFE